MWGETEPIVKHRRRTQDRQTPMFKVLMILMIFAFYRNLEMCTTLQIQPQLYHSRQNLVFMFHPLKKADQYVLIKAQAKHSD